MDQPPSEKQSTPTTSSSLTQPGTTTTRADTPKAEDLLIDDDYLGPDETLHIPPISPLPTPPNKQNARILPLEAQKEGAESRALLNARQSEPPAPGLRAIPIGIAAGNHPQQPQNNRLHKAFQDVVKKEIELEVMSKSETKETMEGGP